MIKKIRTAIDRMRKVRYYYVCADIVPDATTGQGEVDSVVTKARDPEEAKEKAVEIFMELWEVNHDDVWIVEVTETSADEYYNNQ